MLQKRECNVIIITELLQNLVADIVCKSTKHTTQNYQKDTTQNS